VSGLNDQNFTPRKIVLRIGHLEQSAARYLEEISGHLSHRGVMHRQSLSLPNMISIRLRC